MADTDRIAVYCKDSRNGEELGWLYYEKILFGLLGRRARFGQAPSLMPTEDAEIYKGAMEIFNTGMEVTFFHLVPVAPI